MPLADFYGARPNPLAIADAFRVGGQILEIRPLTLDDVLRLWDACRPWLGQWAAFVLASQEASTLDGDDRDAAVAALDLSWMDPVQSAALRVLWGRHGVEWRDAVMKKSTAAEVLRVMNWYRENHDWPRIMERVFGLTVGDDGDLEHDDRDENPLMVLYKIEREGGRRIEESLSMRVESYLSWLDMTDEWLEVETSKDKRAVAKGKGKIVHDPRLFGIGMPGFGPIPEGVKI